MKQGRVLPSHGSPYSPAPEVTAFPDKQPKCLLGIHLKRLSYPKGMHIPAILNCSGLHLSIPVHPSIVPVHTQSLACAKHGLWLFSVSLLGPCLPIYHISWCASKSGLSGMEFCRSQLGFPCFTGSAGFSMARSYRTIRLWPLVG